MKILMTLLIMLTCNHLNAEDNTCATVHGCPASGMSAQEQEQWSHETGGNTKPAKAYETARMHSIYPTIGMRISAEAFVKQYDSHCEVRRTITAHNESDEVACGGGYAGELVGDLPHSEYIYIDNGVITAIQKREPTSGF